MYAHLYFVIFGLISIAGGVIGFVKANSKASLIAGGISGLLLVAAGILLLQPSYGLVLTGVILGFAISAALLGRFLPALMRGKMMPAAYMAPLAAIGVAVAIMVGLGLHH